MAKLLGEVLEWSTVQPVLALQEETPFNMALQKAQLLCKVVTD